MGAGPRITYEKTQKEYASIYRVSERTIKRWWAKGYPLDNREATLALIGGQKHAPEAVKKAAPSTSSKDRKLELECQKLELDIAIRRGEHTPNEQIRADMARIATATRSELMRLNNDLPGVLAGKGEAEIKKDLTEKFDKVLANLSDAFSSLYQPPATVEEEPCP